ncbi:hypothetical protein GQ600_5280 [Phytophthora cactorum]|nr:hypothetical protein GQ600_5280 [Phytophthora cactorum]
MEAKLSDFGVSRERHAMETHMTAGIGRLSGLLRGKVEETAILRMVAAGELIPDFTENCPKGAGPGKGVFVPEPDDRPSATEVVYAIQQIMSRSSVSYGGWCEYGLVVILVTTHVDVTVLVEF